MKKTVITIGIIVVLLLGGLLFLQNVNINRLGTDSYYTQVIGDGEPIESQTSSGEIYTDYQYSLSGYNTDGNEITLDFKATKQLRQGAFLQVFVKDDKVVTSYEEVTTDEIPEKVLEQLQ
ncbi:YxeA family protein [Gracilibacillus sp. S3-1-1]|uniref:YxeA family protein n=1 Tax=Gracilibacillus pellucidus TaxID=3095368 RepID=A0ACC6M204_9BACI|nr:YxeA family protein [Gracilibacillus sp. S3-1-1]MDX8044979.1 YxeA family protein [Gracilibacillus sp. S3-1-1]